MILRVEIDNVAAMVQLDGEPWSPDLVQTLIRICGDEVVRAAICLGASLDSMQSEGEEGPPGE